MTPETTEVEWPLKHRIRVLAHRAKEHDFSAWEREYLEALLRVLKPGMVVYDIGAEEAEFSALAGSVVGSGFVHLFEPVPEVWPNIQAIMDANELDPGGCFAGFVGARTMAPHSHDWRKMVEQTEYVVPKALWPKCSQGPIREFSGFAVEVERPDIPSVSLDDYAAATGAWPDVLMIDVEGAEVQVLKGAMNVLREARPLVFCSVHPPVFFEKFGGNQFGQPELVPGEGHDQQEYVFRIMSEAGYHARFLGWDHEAHWLFESIK